ncbi:hypothetical protein [Oceanomicrobium pacificus]|uniref:Uncharacterized protein n=1 Tax=Oceanomicrobium pacificus TaxID=2692916 RepID=A0A6B0TM64_9RHOB|nr:hypothetical protein [Oceanomicrobium pacificus]MXU64986.1 hypothetical protein [Oceanomicrobium pacificus]
MSKSVATLCVIGWSAFWCFGFLALSAPAPQAATLPMLLAFAGFIAGSWSYLTLARRQSPMPRLQDDSGEAPDVLS